MNSLSTKVVKTLVFLTAVATILSLSGFVLAPQTAFASAKPSDYGLKEGDTISAAGSNDPDVYIINDAGYKRLFLNPVIFNFYGHLGGFANVHNVAAATRDAFPTSGLFRNCETNAQAVYGVEVTGEDTGILHWVNTTGAQAVADDPNFFQKVFCINNNEFNWYAKGTAYTSVSQIPNYVRVPGTPPPAYGPISASLAVSNPVSGTIVNGQARYDLAEFMFSGSGTVTNVQLKRIGVSADATLTNVYLYDGTKRLTDSATVSSGVISFNDAGGLFTVSGSKVISVLADVSGSAGETVGVQLTGVNGTTYSISGNVHALATATLATTAMSATTTPSTSGDPVPASDFIAWQNSVTIGQRYVWLKSVQLRVVGSVAVGDLQNFRFYVDGVQAGSAVAQQGADGYIVFDMSGSPVKLETGSRTLKVLVDIIGGSGKNFYLSLRQKSDIWTVDSQYSASVLASGSFPVSSGAQNIASGTLTITKTQDSPSGDVVKGASGVVLGRFEFKAAGERMKVENLRISNTSAPYLALRNGALFADGVQIGSTQTIWNDLSPAASSTYQYTEYSLGSSLIVTPGTVRIVEIRADIFDASGTDNTAAGNTITANIVAGASNVQRLTTLDYPATPYTAKTGNQLTIRTGSLTAGKYTGYANQSVVAPKTGVKLGAYTLFAASSEDVNMNTLTFDAVPAIPASLSGDFSDAYVKVYNDTGSLILTSGIKSTFSTSASNSYSVNFLLPKNKTYQVELWATVNSSFDTTGGVGYADVVTTNFDAAGVTTGSSTTATAVQVTGQTITSATGSLTKGNGSLLPATLARGGSTVNAYAFTLAPAYDDYYIDEVYVDIPWNGVGSTAPLASSSGAVATLQLTDGSGNQIGSLTSINGITGSASFTGLNRPLLASGGTQTFKVNVMLANVGNGANDTYGSVTVRLDGLKYRNSSGTVTTQNGYVPASFTGNAIIDVAGYPVIANQALGSSILSTGAKDIFQANISSVGTGAALKRIIFSVTTNSGPIIGTVTANNLTNGTYKIFKDGVDITSFGTIATGSADLHASAAARTGAVAFTFTNDEALDAGGHVYKLQVNVTAIAASPQSIVTQIANNSTTASAPDDSANATLMPAVPLVTSPSVVWTDSSTVAHASTTDDYMNDYLVKTINVSQSISM